MNIKKKIDLKELIQAKISAYDIYAYYMPWKFELNKNCRNPFQKDNIPSFRIYYKDGDCFHKSFNDSHKGDAIRFVQDYFNINFRTALKKICEDFGLLEASGDKYDRIIQHIPIIEKKESVMPDIKARDKAFTSKHEEYLAQYYLSLDDINIFEDTEILALDKFWLNKSLFTLNKDEIGFIYYAKSINKVKIYLPLREKGSKFWSSIPFDYIHGLHNLKNCNKGLLVKSIKDAWVVHKFTKLPLGVVQAENPSCFTEKNMEYINNNVIHPYLSWDSDAPGVKNCIEATEKTKWGYINPPKKYLPIKDWADLTLKYGEAPLITEFKRKKLI